MTGSKQSQLLKIIPQCDPRASYLEQAAEIDAAIRRVLDRGLYVLADEVHAFEAELAESVPIAHAISLANCTQAIEIALRAINIESGDVVVTSAHTATGTLSAIRAAGGLPAVVDVDPQHGLMCPDRLEQMLSEGVRGRGPLARQRVRAIIPVHLYGRCADMAAIKSIADRFDLKLIEDCAQAQGASWHGKPAGTWGEFGALSFYPTKNLGALGDGGALITSDARLADRARSIRQYGWRERYVSNLEGVNSRLDELQAAVLRVKLVAMADANQRRKMIAAQYRSLLASLPLSMPAEHEGHVYHQFVVRTPKRDALQFHLKKNGIGTNIHYPVPLHHQPAYSKILLKDPLGLAETEAWSRQVLSLPIYPQLQPHDVTRVAAEVSIAMAELQ